MECQKCEKKIKNRYIVKVVSYNAYNGFEINPLDLNLDIKKEIKKLLREAAKKSSKKLLEDVYTFDEFSLCRECRDGFIKKIRSGFCDSGKH